MFGLKKEITEDSRKISELTVDEFKALMDALLDKHDPVARENKRQHQYANRGYMVSNNVSAYPCDMYGNPINQS